MLPEERTILRSALWWFLQERARSEEYFLPAQLAPLLPLLLNNTKATAMHSNEVKQQDCSHSHFRQRKNATSPTLSTSMSPSAKG